MCCGAIRWAGIHRVVYGTTSSQLSRVVDRLLPPRAASTAKPALLECREVFARTDPSIAVRGPLMETEGLVIHENYWPNDPVLKPHFAAPSK
jgi:tRNA(Arg) A34 adenosine deaminase TadA